MFWGFEEGFDRDFDGIKETCGEDDCGSCDCFAKCDRCKVEFCLYAFEGGSGSYDRLCATCTEKYEDRFLDVPNPEPEPETW